MDHKATIEFFTTGKANFGTVDSFKTSWAGQYLESIFGEMVWMPDVPEYYFIGIAPDGTIHNEIYYPMLEKRLGSFIPRSFLKFKRHKPHPLWKDVQENGFAAIENYKIGSYYKDEIWKQEYDSAIDETMLLPSYLDKIDYENPEKTFNPRYLQELSYLIYDDLKIAEKGAFCTTDSIKYLYKEGNESTEGPYVFHMDFMERLYGMFFHYHAKQPIEGRELVIGYRDLESFPFSNPQNDKPLLSKNIPMANIAAYKEIKIKNDMIVVMNSVNPLFVHRVNKLKSDNEVILLTNYIWV